MRAPLILVVDDDPRGRKLSSAQLRDAGFAVETAASADEAWTKVMGTRPDAILSDVVMDDVDGFRFCQRVRNEESLAGVPVVLISSHFGSAADRQLAAEVGASELVMRTPDGLAELAALKASLQFRAPVVTAEAAAVNERHLEVNARQLVRMADKVRTAEERYRTLFDHANEALAVLSPDGVVLEVNARWSDMLGMNPAEVVGRSVRDLSPPGQEDANLAHYQASLNDHDRRVAPVLGGDGKTHFMDFSTRAIVLDGKPVVLASGHDVTEQVRASQALALAQDRERSIVERIPDVIWSCDGSGRLVFITQNVERVLGRSAAQMMAESAQAWVASIHPDDRDDVLARFREMLEAGTLFDFEYRRQKDDGTYQWIRSRTFASHRRDGVLYFEGMMTDVTERRQLEDALRQSQKLESLGQLTGGIAHDFNNLLTAILSSSEFLAADLPEGNPLRDDAIEITRAAERATALTRQLLTFSRRQVVDPRPVDLNALVVGLQKMLARLIGSSIASRFSPCADLGNVRADPGQIEQVIVNLVVNARDAMPAGGEIAIATRKVMLDAAAAAALQGKAGQYAVLSVADTGSGIDPATLRRLFEPFFTTKEVGKGTGLGLSTCYGIVKQTGGFIAVDTEVGKGTRFDVYLPYTEGLT